MKDRLTRASEIAEGYRINDLPSIIKEQQSELGQFMTPSIIAHFMADSFSDLHARGKITILDPGAGVGSLSSALIGRILTKFNNIKDINLIAYEIDLKLKSFLEDVMLTLDKSAEDLNVTFQRTLFSFDFIEKVSIALSNELFEAENIPQFSHIIMNPPYKKIKSNSIHRKLLSNIGIETSNLYTAFLSLAMRLLEPGGELVAITPRSFCNGSYFSPFRRDFNKEMSIKKIHVFHSRNKAFKDDEVLQENIIFLAIKGGTRDTIKITASTGTDFLDITEREVEYSKVINDKDPNKIIHIATDELDEHVIERVNAFHSSYKDLGLTISTGPVVDFRMKEFLRKNPEKNTIPLLYMAHMNSGVIEWPKDEIKKYNSIVENESTQKWFMPTGFYTLVKRFSAKEEKRRIVSSFVNPKSFVSDKLGFENHLNVFHTEKNGLEELLAKGLSVWLNSSIVDLYFRQFNGNTQVNASDLRILPYPDYEFLIGLGKELHNKNYPAQDEIDNLIETKLITEKNIKSINPLSANKKVQKMAEILREYPTQNKKSDFLLFLIILSLLNIRPESYWKGFTHIKRNIFEIQGFIKDNYGKMYSKISIESCLKSHIHKAEHSIFIIKEEDLSDKSLIGLELNLIDF